MRALYSENPKNESSSDNKIFLSPGSEYYFQKQGMPTPFEKSVSYISYKDFRKHIFSGNDTLWVKIKFLNPDRAKRTYLLSWNYSRKQIHLWGKDGESMKLADSRNYVWMEKYKPSPYRLDHFTLTADPGENEFYLQFEQMDAAQLFLYLWEPEEFIQSNSQDNIIYAIFTGILIIIIFYNLSLFLSFNDRYYLYFAAYILTGLTAFPFRDHYFHAWLGRNIAVLPYEFVIFRIILVLSFWFMLFYVYSFLVLKKDRWNTSIQYALHASLILSITAPLLGSTFWASISYLFFIIGIFTVAIREMITNPKENKAIWLLFTFGLFLIGVISEILRVMGILDDAYRYTMSASVVAQVIILSFYMTQRVTSLRREKIAIQEALLETKEKEAERLEITVKERTRELEVANAAKEKFLSVLAHDLRGPIANITNLLSLSRESSKPIDSVKLDLLHGTSKKVYDLLDQLLTWGLTQKGLIEFQPKVFEVSEKLKEITALFSELAAAKNISLNVENESSEKLLTRADPNMTDTILRNLISNAIKFTERGGNISCSANISGNFLKINVSDSGIGMEKHNLENLFSLHGEIFRSYGTEKEKGSGLGLIICKEFVKINGGQIGCVSELNKGSNFWFTLPAEV